MKDRNEKMVKEILDHVHYTKCTVFDAILEISEQKNIDVEDIFKMLDENLKQQAAEDCINERKVISIPPKKKSIDCLFV